MTRRRRVAAFNARVAAVVKRLALRERDLNRSMHGESWDQEERASAQDMLRRFKEVVAKLDATAGPLAEYAARVNADGVKELGHLTRFLGTVAPVVKALTTQVGNLATMLKSYV